ncbi:MAG: glycosyltransferase, partial [Chitinivibrionales bacterium]|nr:glycosyltransferase [Chitinivibrionales bacterium]
LVHWKNHMLAIETMKHLNMPGIDMSLDIWGSDPLKENYKYANEIKQAMATEKNARIRIIENKRILSEDYQNYDCLLHTAENEPFGRVIVEAIGNACPVIVHNSGGPAEIVKKYEAGILFNELSIVSCAEAVQKAAQSYNRIRRTILKRLPRIRSEFSEKKAIQAFLKIELVRQLVISSRIRDTNEESIRESSLFPFASN